MRPENKKLLEKILAEEFAGETQKFVEYVKEISKPKEISAAELAEKNEHQKNLSQRKVLISLQKVSKTYERGNDTIMAIDNLDLEIREGEFVAVIGPSGSGKSTLLQLIGAIDKPTSGTIKVSDAELNKFSEKEKAKYRNQVTSFVFQSFNLQPYLNVEENIEIPLVIAGIKRKDRHEKASGAIEEVSMGDRLKHLPKELSGGQMQRVSIARALINNPKLILADEPTANLDRTNANQALSLLKKINRELGTTIILVTHDKLVSSQTDREIKILDGRLEK